MTGHPGTLVDPIPVHMKYALSLLTSVASPCPDTHAIARARSLARAKNRPCQYHYQPCNSTCQLGAFLSQLQHFLLSSLGFKTLLLSYLFLNETFGVLQQHETLFWIHRSRIALAFPNNLEQSLMQTLE